MKYKTHITKTDVLVLIGCFVFLIMTVGAVGGEGNLRAKLAVCMSHISKQYLAQIAYTLDNNGKFPQHWGGDPFCARDTIFYPGMEYVWEAYHQNYITDGRIFECPVMKSKGGIWRDNEYLYSAGSAQGNCVGGWGAVMDVQAASDWGVPVGSPSPYKLMGYGWFANYRFPGFFSITMNPNISDEDPWPDRWEECTSRTAMVSHIAAGNTDGDFIHWNFLHGGFGETDPGVSEELSKYFDNPVGYGDGHITFHKAADIKPRACWGDTWGPGQIAYWY